MRPSIVLLIIAIEWFGRRAEGDTGGFYKTALAALKGLEAIFPDDIKVDVVQFESRNDYFEWLEANRASIGIPDAHKTSPIVWFETGNVLGGKSDTMEWCRSLFDGKLQKPSIPAPVNIDAWNPDHGFDYDLVVIGGGSGGLACAKEAKAVNSELRVALLDFVKPSPAGSKWGLGGTCVNVGCIPKKLMHQAALLGEAARDAPYFGWGNKGSAGAHSWEALVANTQDHIKSLNFGYRVSLREAGVTYLNKLARFTDEPHTLEISDHKGSKRITAARIVVATGGRPRPLDCEGAEHAISSDDIFMKAAPPGKTLVVGASYIALECAGFLQGLLHGSTQPNVQVYVRSILLRGFDRDLVGAVHAAMTEAGVVFHEGVTVSKIQKLENGKLLVLRSDGESEEFDTVLVAVGRDPDTKALNLEAQNVLLKNGKVVCCNEQSSVDHIYAIGDVLADGPELTPVAILAGKLLARRLFGGSRENMDYSKVPTTVFTPLELGTVGLTEDQAIAQFGDDAIDCVMSAFSPLERTLSEDIHKSQCLAKIVFNRKTRDVLGIHIAAPNAGEIIQGFAVALRKGLKREDLLSTVGIHPTIAEEFTVMTVLKSSGEATAKHGC